MPGRVSVTVEVNGQSHRREVEPRLLLSDFLRHELGLTGTHVGCEHGVCGACTVLFSPADAEEDGPDTGPADQVPSTAARSGRTGSDGAVRVSSSFAGDPVRSCLMFAVQADGAKITTVEGLAPGPELLHPLQEAFRDAHALQCGFCTPGILLSVMPFLEENPDPTDREIREALSGNLCRCTGYQNIVEAVAKAARAQASVGRHAPIDPATGDRSDSGAADSTASEPGP